MTRLPTTLVVLIAMVVGACSSKDTPPPPLTWTDCGAGFQCGTVTVPLDDSDAHGATIKIALIRKRAIDQSHRVGSLLVNPGGPGLSGIDFLRNGLVSFAGLNARFDIVSFDRRGVGRSAPVRCLSSAEKGAQEAIDTVLDVCLSRQTYVEAAKASYVGCEYAREGDAGARSADLLQRLDLNPIPAPHASGARHCVRLRFSLSASMFRKLPGLVLDQNPSHRAHPATENDMNDLEGVTVLIVGYGSIGRALEAGGRTASPTSQWRTPAERSCSRILIRL